MKRQTADVAAPQIAVPVPVHAARGAFVVDLPTPGENAQRVGDAPRAGGHLRTRPAADRPQPVADGRAVQPAGGLRGKRQDDRGVIGLLDVGEHRQRAVLGDPGQASHAADDTLSGAVAGPVPYMPPRRAPPMVRTRLSRLAASPKTKSS